MNSPSQKLISVLENNSSAYYPEVPSYTQCIFYSKGTGFSYKFRLDSLAKLQEIIIECQSNYCLANTKKLFNCLSQCKDLSPSLKQKAKWMKNIFSKYTFSEELSDFLIFTTLMKSYANSKHTGLCELDLISDTKNKFLTIKIKVK